MRTHRDIVPGFRESDSTDIQVVEWRPGRLWSLWDIMETFNGGEITRAVCGLSNFGQAPGPEIVMPVENLRNLERFVDRLCSEFSRLELVTPLASAEKIKELLTAAAPCKCPTGGMGNGSVSIA